MVEVILTPRIELGLLPVQQGLEEVPARSIWKASPRQIRKGQSTGRMSRENEKFFSGSYKVRKNINS